MTREFVVADKLKDQFYERNSTNINAGKTKAGTQKRPYRNTVTRGRVSVRKLESDTKTRKNTAKVKNTPITPSKEVKVKWKFISPAFIAVLAVATVMMMFLVFSFSEVYESSNRVSVLQNRLEELKSEESELSLMLDEKNDLHEIETVAITKLGMVKEDSLQKKFVSLSEGERIEVLENNQESTEATGGVMLSSILSALSNLFDRFR